MIAERTKTIPEPALGFGPRRGQPRLRILHSPQTGIPSIQTLTTGLLVIGRKTSTDQNFLSFAQDSGMSSVQARLRVSESDLTVEISDWGSKNGSHLDRKHLRKQDEWHVVPDGAVLRLGNTIFLLRYEPTAPEDVKIPALVGGSLPMKDLRARINKVAREDKVSVLLLGEAGTGKELVANAIHELSPRSKNAFFGINCAAVPESLAESELFGHLANSFTGAKERLGCFRSANHGTLFLDEIGDLPLSIQTKLLRTLQQRTVIPVGSDREEPCDARVVSATNQDLQRDIERGEFRPELHTRLAQFCIELPPLRERKEDILLLLRHFHPGIDEQLTTELVHELLLYHWPQNVRQLQNVAIQLRIEGATPALHAQLRTGAGVVAAVPPPSSPPSKSDPGISVRRPQLVVPTREELIQLLTTHKGVIKQIAEGRGCSRRQIQRWLDDNQLDADEYRR